MLGGRVAVPPAPALRVAAAVACDGAHSVPEGPGLVVRAEDEGGGSTVRIDTILDHNGGTPRFC